MDHTALDRDDIYGDMSFHQTMKPPSPIKPTRRNHDHSQKLSTNRLNQQTFETMEQNIDEYIRNIDKQSERKPNNIDDINLDIDILISQSHQVISQIPTSISSFQEGDHHIKALSTCIAKILKQVEIDKHQLSKLKIDNHQFNNQIKNLQFENNQLSLSNQDDIHQKQELVKKNQDLKQRMKNKIAESDQNHHINHNLVLENNLLREKLIKYRDLYQLEKTKNTLPSTKSVTANEPIIDKSVSELLNQLIHAVNGKKYPDKVGNIQGLEPTLNGPTPNIKASASVETNIDTSAIKNNDQMNRNVTTNDNDDNNNNNNKKKENNNNNTKENNSNNIASNNNNNHHHHHHHHDQNEIAPSTSTVIESDQPPSNLNVRDASEANDLQEEYLIEKVIDLLKKKNERIIPLQQQTQTVCDCQLPICSTCKANGHHQTQLNNETLHIAGEYKWIL